MKKNKIIPRIIQTAFVIVGLLIATPFCYGMYQRITSHADTNASIVETLEKECDCSSISIDHSAFGLQFSKKDGVTSDKVSIVLKDCKLEASVSATVQVVHDKLLTEIEAYRYKDLVEFTFSQDGTRETMVVKNGRINYDHEIEKNH